MEFKYIPGGIYNHITDIHTHMSSEDHFRISRDRGFRFHKNIGVVYISALSGYAIAYSMQLNNSAESEPGPSRLIVNDHGYIKTYSRDEAISFLSSVGITDVSVDIYSVVESLWSSDRDLDEVTYAAP
jgi:hypothetical protein